jgi:2-hydroxychromene-2-carboxylate isomerase
VRVEIFFDCSSPGTWLGFHRLHELGEEFGFHPVLKPIYLGAVFKMVNPGVFEIRATMPAVKDAYYLKDFRDWERLTGLELNWPNPHHPVNSVKAMRGVVAAGRHDKALEMARATFLAYFRDSADISDDAVLRGVCREAGFDAALYFEGVADPSVKDELRDITQELMDRGGFGTPTIFINGHDMYWGNDRIELVRAALERLSAKVPHD